MRHHHRPFQPQSRAGRRVRVRGDDRPPVPARRRPDFTTQQEGPSTAELVRQAEQLRTRLDGLAEAYADETSPRQQVRKGSDKLRGRLSDVEDKLAEAKGLPKAVRAVATAEDVRAAWEAFDVDSRREIIRALAVITRPARPRRPPLQRRHGADHLGCKTNPPRVTARGSYSFSIIDWGL